ncbi:MAG TPA: hypothetical protein VLF40_05325 [Candidatus Saccharimonadales bacterium]|nr:hypothetical protein [Candidatus Saccharimonadales bacterium]
MVRHEWGLFKGRTPQTEPDYDSSRHPSLPDGYSLVAEVDAVKPIVEPDACTEARLAERMVRLPKVCGYGIEDLTTRHVLFQLAGQHALQGWLADFEPRLC